jgi:hypothetical protein
MAWISFCTGAIANPLNQLRVAELRTLRPAPQRAPKDLDLGGLLTRISTEHEGQSAPRLWSAASKKPLLARRTGNGLIVLRARTDNQPAEATASSPLRDSLAAPQAA